ncbi:MAG: zinc-ribbon domain-containing protein [Deltaproteobacteria bacterium]|nr:zinc-ribbon domain-containing protein [Deltaproteobacteria bacterium]
MIIQCDKCHTKFRLDDSKVKGAGVKVRCTKCQNVFIVTPPRSGKRPRRGRVRRPLARRT